MKKTILTLALVLITTLSFSQETTEKTITVRGNFFYKPQVELYKVVMYLQLENNYNSSKHYSTLEELKKDYFKELSEKKIDITQITEDKFAYYSSGGNRDGTFLIYTTTSEKDANKLANLKFEMVGLRQVLTKYASIENQYNTFIKKALKIARVKAEKLAKLKGAKLGEIVNLSEGSDYSPEWSGSHTSYNQKEFELIVTFTTD